MHFTVMVFGDDVERQLAPFQECDVGLIAPEYLVKVDFTDEVEKQFQARRRYGLLGDGRYVELGQAHHCDASGKLVLITGAVVVEMSADEARTHRLGYATLDACGCNGGARGLRASV